jgi:hypothetical protein
VQSCLQTMSRSPVSFIALPMVEANIDYCASVKEPSDGNALREAAFQTALIRNTSYYVSPSFREMPSSKFHIASRFGTCCFLSYSKKREAFVLAPAPCLFEIPEDPVEQLVVFVISLV